MDNDKAPIPKANTVYLSKRSQQRFYIFDVTGPDPEEDDEFYLVNVVLEEDKDDMWACSNELDPDEWTYFYFEQRLELVDEECEPSSEFVVTKGSGAF